MKQRELGFHRPRVKLMNLIEDELLIPAIQLAFHSNRISAKMMQRTYTIGWSRASRLIERMRDLGILGQQSRIGLYKIRSAVPSEIRGVLLPGKILRSGMMGTRGAKKKGD